VRGKRLSVRPFLSHGPFELGADCFQAVVRPFGEGKFPVPQNLDCVRRHPRYGHVAEEPWRVRRYGFIERRFQNPTTDALLAVIIPEVVRAFGKVPRAQPAPCARSDSPRFCGCGFALGRFILGQEIGRPRGAAKPHFGPTLGAVIDAPITVPVLVLTTAGGSCRGMDGEGNPVIAKPSTRCCQFGFRQVARREIRPAAQR
jgi:hypothetical protein